MTGNDPTETGFLGCMRYMKVMGESVDNVLPENNKGVINGTCNVQDRYKANLFIAIIEIT